MKNDEGFVCGGEGGGVRRGWGEGGTGGGTGGGGLLPAALPLCGVTL